MDHLNTFATVASVPVKPVTGRRYTPLSLHEFSLVYFDKFGYPQPIPPGIAELPLYLENHGFYSVNGPLDLTGLAPRAVYYPHAKEDGSWRDGSNVDIVPSSSETWHIAPRRPSNYWNPDNRGFYSVKSPQDLTGLSARTLYGSEGRHTTPYPPSYYLNHNAISCEPRAGSGRRSYPCHEPGCTWRASFPIKQALDRHHEVKHQNKRINCPIPGCARVGDSGIKRKDNLPSHVWNKHQIKMARHPQGN